MGTVHACCSPVHHRAPLHGSGVLALYAHVRLHDHDRCGGARSPAHDAHDRKCPGGCHGCEREPSPSSQRRATAGRPGCAAVPTSCAGVESAIAHAPAAENALVDVVLPLCAGVQEPESQKAPWFSVVSSRDVAPAAKALESGPSCEEATAPSAWVAENACYSLGFVNASRRLAWARGPHGRPSCSRYKALRCRRTNGSAPADQISMRYMSCGTVSTA
mmetsp:Transcript_72740/g.168584  ORF Transcript_72740/g.168584 Transcript_72740/m.168584 type:complete len:218 (+) Transcript_72740:588-1241(+)